MLNLSSSDVNAALLGVNEMLREQIAGARAMRIRGRGTYGTVYDVCLPEEPDTESVLKVVRHADCTAEMIENEVACMRRVKFAPFVHAVRHDMERKTSFILMEDVGQTWSEQARAAGNAFGTEMLSRGAALSAAAETMLLEFDRARVVHCDLSPHNVALQTVQDHDEHVVMRPIDFGMAISFEHGKYPTCLPRTHRWLGEWHPGYDAALLSTAAAHMWRAYAKSGIECPFRLRFDPELAKAYSTAHQWLESCRF